MSTTTALRARLVVGGDDVYEDLFTAAAALPDILADAGILAGRSVALDRADLVVLYTATSTLPALTGIEAAVRGGTGLLALHSTAVLPGATELFGARFRDHGPRPHESRFRVHTADSALTRGVPPFDLHHEHYRLAVTADATVDAWRQTAAGPEPLVLRRRLGVGRAGYVQFGHDMRVWAEPGVRTIVGRIARWAATGSEGEV